MLGQEHKNKELSNVEFDVQKMTLNTKAAFCFQEDGAEVLFPILPAQDNLEP